MTWTVRADRWLRAHPIGPDTLLALLLTAVLGWYALAILRASTAEPWVQVTAGACSAALLGAVSLRRAATETAFGIGTLAMLVTVALPNATVRPIDIAMSEQRTPLEMPLFFLPTSAIFLVLVHAMAAHRAAPRSTIALGVGLVGAALCTAKTATAYGALPAGWLTLLLAALALAAAVAGTWAVGVVQRERRERRGEELAEAAENAVAEERRRIARDMHDIVAHSLAVIVRQAEGGASIVGTAPDRAAGALATIADTAREALADMRGTLAVLRDGTPSEDAQPTVAEVPVLVERVRDTGVDVRLSEVGSRTRMTPAAMMATYRLVQEALTNSVKHAGPRTTVTVALAHGEHSTVVTVTDDGGVADGRTTVPGTGAGLLGVRDRVRAAGGTFEAGRDGDGFRVRAEFTTATGSST